MQNIDMTVGSPTKKMLLFTLPIFLGNVFQQIYSISDTFVVGRFLGKEALAAIGASSALVIFINAIIIGLCMGSGVLFAEFFGAKNDNLLSKAVSTAGIFIGGITVAISAFFLILLEPLIRLFQVPEPAIHYAQDYLLIILSGLLFMMLYNFATAVLRAVGDSQTPLVFLVLSSVVNVALDFILVLYTPLGVKGPAWSTVAAQVCSGVPLCWYAVKKLNVPLRLQFDQLMFRKVAQYSVLTSIQQSIMNFGILLVQGLVNSFGVVATAAFTVGVRIDTFAYMPAQDFGNAFAIYVAQNRGAKQRSRIRQGLRGAFYCVTVFCIVISVVVWLWAPQLIALFSPDLGVINIGAQYLRIEGLFYSLIGYLFLFYALFRGMGQFKTSIVLTIVSLGTRVALSYSLVWLGFGLNSIWYSIPIGWALADLVGMICYKRQHPRGSQDSLPRGSYWQ